MKQLIFISALFICGTLHSQTTVPFHALKRNINKLDSATGHFITEGTPSSEVSFHWLPSIKNQDYFEKDAPKFFQNNIISYNDSLSNIALYSELASDYIGPVRVSAGITLAYPKSDTNTVQQEKINREKFVQRFATGGGAVSFNFILPLFAYNGAIFGTTMTAGPRFSLEPPSFGVTSDKFAHNTGIGTDINAELRGVKGIFKFYGTTRFSYVAGNSAFYDGVQLKGDDRKGFFLNNFMIGVNIKDIFTLSYTKYWGSNNIEKNLSGYLAFTVEPTF